MREHYGDSDENDQTFLTAYLDHRDSAEETFLETYRRLGLAPFKAALYPDMEARNAA